MGIKKRIEEMVFKKERTENCYVYYIKTVTYKCGCVIKIGPWLESSTPKLCKKHAEKIVKIVEEWK